ncbi:MAG: tRNA pseudouridine(55) synthase TruB [Bacteroidales bacterium]|nr:tRNA pseudouridine(55) synthase TruB [Bacteroidales bacterium]
MEKKQEYDFIAGEILLFDKPLQWTSFDLVKKVRATLKHHLNVKKIKVGHAGTLDPLATGLMILCTGKKTKKIEQIVNTEKEYIAQIEFGATTPSYDKETDINSRFPFEHINLEKIQKILKEQFSGEVEQYPPIFSAKRVDGRRAYDLAREGKTPELKPSIVYFYETEILSFESPNLNIKIKCSKGTYIRSLAYDLGKALGSGAYLTGLQRTRIGDYKIDDALSIHDFREIIDENTIKS